MNKKGIGVLGLDIPLDWLIIIVAILFSFAVIIVIWNQYMSKWSPLQ